MPGASPFEFGSEYYREGAMLRLREAQVLYDNGEWVGCVYLAGRAAESILRALLWSQTRQQEIGHDLRVMLRRARPAARFGTREEEALEDAVNELAVVWRNDLRFTGLSRFKRILDESGRLHSVRGMKVKGDPLKANAKSVVEAAERIVATGEPYVRRIAGQAGPAD